MKLVLHADPLWLRKVFSLAGSVGLHCFVLAWVVFGPAVEDRTPILDRQIRSNTRIVWYSLKQPLPAISPAERPSEKRAPRALTRSPRTLVAGPQDLLRPPQLIWTPAPPLEKPKMLPSPNIVALAAPAQLRPRSFVPPLQTRATAPAVVLPAAPELTAAMAPRTNLSRSLPPLAVARKTFIPPVEAAHRAEATPVSLPAAPHLVETVPDRPLLTTAPAKPLRAFTPPEPKMPLPAPAAPIVEAPQMSSANGASQASLAIVGLFPVRNPEIPAPQASQQAGFSTGPQPRPTGADDAADRSQLVVPGLLARDTPIDPHQLLAASLEPPTSARNLLAAARAARIADPRDQSPAQEGAAVAVSQAPDPRFEGRMVYSMALQMPNITSYSGSWLVWFAERGPGALSHPAQAQPGIKPPSPVHKVDPKYDPSAAGDRVEGKVRLAAVIHKDGRVDTVEILQSLDGRLDRSAAEAIAKWEFEPARRNGTPIDVDAVFDIPFHLAPRSSK
jgi:TonB family protein